MRKFYKSNTFLAVFSLITAIVIWIYVVYEVTPIYDTWIKNVPVHCINTNTMFEDGSIVVVGDNSSLLKDGATVDVKVRGRRSTISSLSRDDFTCTIDMITVNKSGSYTLRPSVETNISGVEVLQVSPNAIKFSVDNISQKDIPVFVKTTGSLPDGYTMENIENHTATVKITAPSSVIDNIKKVEAVLELDTLDVKSTEAAAKLCFYDSNGKQINTDNLKKTIDYAKLTFDINTVKEVTVLLKPRYKEDINTNSQDRRVFLKITSGGTADGDGVKIKVKMKGSAKIIENYASDVKTVFTEEIDVSDVTGSRVFENIKAAELSKSNSVQYVDVPVVTVEATVAE